VIGLQIRGVKIDGKRTLNQGKTRSDWAAVVDRLNYLILSGGAQCRGTDKED